MKNGKVIKSAYAPDIEAEMALVNTYSRRELTPDEVYLFTVVLCDNDVDRDNERFTVESLFELEKLFVGKTGIIDHDPTAKNQKARIISCRVETVEGARTALGDELFRLTARAYIRRTQGNAELIEAIESGIVKEVSVGCAVSKTLCSICRGDISSPSCSHVKGREYGGELCVGELTEPTDAYEFSFVAVPAQRAAGVIKSCTKENTMKDITKLLESERITLERADIAALKEYIESLKADSEYVSAYREELIYRLKDGCAAKGIELSYAIEKSITDKLSLTELKGLIEAMNAGSRAAAAPQLFVRQASSPVGNTEFRI